MVLKCCARNMSLTYVDVSAFQIELLCRSRRVVWQIAIKFHIIFVVLNRIQLIAFQVVVAVQYSRVSDPHGFGNYVETNYS